MELGLAENPQLLIVGGPNGSGKTTVALQYASTGAIPYIGADAIAASLNAANPTDVSIEAGKQFLSSIDAAIASRRSCVVESTLAGRSFSRRVIQARNIGYNVTIVFVFLDSADTCIARIAERVRKGGHHVPEEDVRRRFGRSVTNFWSIYRELADSWVVLYNGGDRIHDVSIGSRRELIIRDATLHSAFMSLVD